MGRPRRLTLSFVRRSTIRRLLWNRAGDHAGVLKSRSKPHERIANPWNEPVADSRRSNPRERISAVSVLLGTLCSGAAFAANASGFVQTPQSKVTSPN